MIDTPGFVCEDCGYCAMRPEPHDCALPGAFGPGYVWNPAVFPEKAAVSVADKHAQRIREALRAAWWEFPNSEKDSAAGHGFAQTLDAALDALDSLLVELDLAHEALVAHHAAVTGADERAQRIRDVLDDREFATPDVQAADAALDSLLAELDRLAARLEAAERALIDLEKRRQREVLAVRDNAESAQERMRQELVRVDSLARDRERALQQTREAQRLLGFAQFNLNKGKYAAVETLIEKARQALAADDATQTEERKLPFSMPFPEERP